MKNQEMYCCRCKSYSKGQSSICFDKYEKRYEVVSGYESVFDMLEIYLTENFENEEELRERFPWITDIGREFDNLCDKCVRDMIEKKEARSEDEKEFRAPFYTACCDNYVLKVAEADLPNFLVVVKVKKFPYISYYLIVSWEDEYKYAMQDFEGTVYFVPEDKEFFNYYKNCTICKDCFDKNFSKYEPTLIEDHPVLHDLPTLKSNMEMLVDFHLRDKVMNRFSCNTPEFQEEFLERFYMYESRKNMLDLKSKLRAYFLKRNLAIIRRHIPISKDIYNMILNAK